MPRQHSRWLDVGALRSFIGDFRAQSWICAGQPVVPADSARYAGGHLNELVQKTLALPDDPTPEERLAKSKIAEDFFSAFDDSDYEALAKCDHHALADGLPGIVDVSSHLWERTIGRNGHTMLVSDLQKQLKTIVAVTNTRHLLRLRDAFVQRELEPGYSRIDDGRRQSPSALLDRAVELSAPRRVEFEYRTARLDAQELNEANSDRGLLLKRIRGLEPDRLDAAWSFLGRETRAQIVGPRKSLKACEALICGRHPSKSMPELFPALTPQPMARALPPAAVTAAAPIKPGIADESYKHLQRLVAELKTYLQDHRSSPAEEVQQGSTERLRAIVAAAEETREAYVADKKVLQTPPQVESTLRIIEELGDGSNALIGRFNTRNTRMVEPEVKGVSARTVGALIVAANGPFGSIDPPGTNAPNVAHMSTVAEGVLRESQTDPKSTMNHPLTQTEVDLLVLQTFATDITGKGRKVYSPIEIQQLGTRPLPADALNGMPLAPILSTRNQVLIGRSAELVWAHMTHQNSQVKEHVAAEVLHAKPSFDIVNEIVLNAGWKKANALRTYACVLAHGETGYAVNQQVRGGIEVAYDKLLLEQKLTASDVNILKDLQWEAMLLHGEWRWQIDLAVREMGGLSTQQRDEFEGHAQRMVGVMERLPNELRWQLQADDYQQPTLEGAEKWLNTGRIIAISERGNRNPTNRDVLNTLLTGAFQAYQEQAWALGFGDKFKANFDETARRWGLVYRPDAGDTKGRGHWEEAGTQDGAVYADFRQRVLQSDAVVSVFRQDHPEVKELDGDQVVEWIRDQYAGAAPDIAPQPPARLNLYVELLRTP